MLRCIVVDDEPLAQRLLADYISKIPYLQQVALCNDAFEATAVLQQQQVDLVFADIQMPGLTGLQLVESLVAKPMVIFITAYEKFALEGYNLDVVDYLLKPVELNRFIKACNKAWELHQLRQNKIQQQAPPDYFFVPADYSMLKIKFADIAWIEGLRDYIKIHPAQPAKPLVVRMSMHAVEAELPADRFIRVHKSYIVAVEHITAIRKNSLFIGDKELPVGETFRENVALLLRKRSS
jgi:DNA-binding LytR/AlgR family response regulator